MNFKSGIIVALGLGVGFVMGLVLRHNRATGQGHGQGLPALPVAAVAPSFPSSSEKPTRTPAARPEAASASHSSLSAQRAREMEQAVLEMELPEVEKLLWKSREVNPWEKKLKLALLAARHADSISGGEDLGTSYLDDFRAHPTQTMDAIRSLVPKLDVASFPIDRASLLDVAASLPGQQAQARALAIEEVNSVIAPVLPDPNKASSEAERDRILSTDPKALIPMVAEAVVLRTGESESDDLSETLKAITSQQDPMLRNTLASQFVQKYPERKGDVIATLQKLGTPIVFDPQIAHGVAPFPGTIGAMPAGETK